ncbi:hypothetical protein CONLIGDRAFT_224425 [Coniochaeta ligniaria NRRL 30616]|uniref:Uncharacterized protein n=1 Tax=Coniochaeta ligniaria NRRL 30616 TaxID=1408157 RepID=A0A1J7IMM4_9PEZI|nr:hypothetical protein CONLIGDRAFT_224425 [Coniochaeta ligniaria NRRL 30616]
MATRIQSHCWNRTGEHDRELVTKLSSTYDTQQEEEGRSSRVIQLLRCSRPRKRSRIIRIRLRSLFRSQPQLNEKETQQQTTQITPDPTKADKGESGTRSNDYSTVVLEMSNQSKRRLMIRLTLLPDGVILPASTLVSGLIVMSCMVTIELMPPSIFSKPRHHQIDRVIHPRHLYPNWPRLPVTSKDLTTSITTS